MNERWIDIDGFPGYEVSDQGNVRNKETGKYLSTKHQDRGKLYCQVCLKRDGTYANKMVHRIVAEAFIPNPDKKPQVHHKNKNKGDNRADNLEWVTQREHSKRDARPRSETAYFINREARKRLKGDIM